MLSEGESRGVFAKSDPKVEDVSGGARQKLRMSRAAGAKVQLSLQFFVFEAPEASVQVKRENFRKKSWPQNSLRFLLKCLLKVADFCQLEGGTTLGGSGTPLGRANRVECLQRVTQK